MDASELTHEYSWRNGRVEFVEDPNGNVYRGNICKIDVDDKGFVSVVVDVLYERVRVKDEYLWRETGYTNKVIFGFKPETTAIEVEDENTVKLSIVFCGVAKWHRRN